MFKDINGAIVYERGSICVIVDSITPAIIEERMNCAGFDSRFSQFIAYNGGMNSREDAIGLGKIIGRIKPLLQ